MILLIKEIRTIPGTKADNAEMWSLEENKEIKENQVGIEINQLEENGKIEATNLAKKSKEDNNNSNNNIRRIDLYLIIYISTPIKTCLALAFLGKNYDKITTEMLSWIIVLSIVTLISSLGTVNYLSKLLWNAVALDTAISMLDLLREDDDDTTRNRSSKLSWER
nr:1703_t:CDS:2 [Entrophospora candida]